MIKRTITKEQFDNTDYPLCRNCVNYHNAYSTVFGDCWTCTKGHDSIMVDDNHWDIETSKILEIYDCGDYEEGNTTTVVLG